MALFIETMDTVRHALHTFAVLNEIHWAEHGRYTTDRAELAALGGAAPHDSVAFEMILDDDTTWVQYSATHLRTGPDAGCATSLGSPRNMLTPGGMAVLDRGPVVCDGDTPPAFTAEIRAVVERYLSALDARDATTVREMIVHDGRFAWIEDGTTHYDSAEEVMAGSELFPTDRPLETTVRVVDVDMIGAAGARARVSFSTVVGPHTWIVSGWHDFILERTPDGWRIVGGTTSLADDV